MEWFIFIINGLDQWRYWQRFTCFWPKFVNILTEKGKIFQTKIKCRTATDEQQIVSIEIFKVFPIFSTLKNLFLVLLSRSCIRSSKKINEPSVWRRIYFKTNEIHFKTQQVHFCDISIISCNKCETVEIMMLNFVKMKEKKVKNNYN